MVMGPGHITLLSLIILTQFAISYIRKCPFTLGYDIITPKRLNFNSSVEQWVNTYMAFFNLHCADIQGLFLKTVPTRERIACVGGPKIYCNHKKFQISITPVDGYLRTLHCFVFALSTLSLFNVILICSLAVFYFVRVELNMSVCILKCLKFSSLKPLIWYEWFTNTLFEIFNCMYEMVHTLSMLLHFIFA